jgi:hypothetical protein
MNKHVARVLAWASILTPVWVGCERYRNAVDPCWPERYNFTARKSVVDAFAPQVQNGQILDQTAWNHFFVTGTDELSGLGRAKINEWIRRRPQPDPHIFVQTAHDLTIDPANPEAFAVARQQLDQKRIQAIQRYIASQTVGRPMQFEFAIHDPTPVGVPAAYASGNLRLARTATTTGVLGNNNGSGSLDGSSAPGSGSTATNPSAGGSSQGQGGSYGSANSSANSTSGNPSGQ